MEKTVQILNETGMHARPASVFAKLAQGFKSQIDVLANQKKANAKSVMSLMSLALTQKTSITIVAQGEDEEQAVNALVQLIEEQINKSH